MNQDQPASPNLISRRKPSDRRHNPTLVAVSRTMLPLFPEQA